MQKFMLNSAGKLCLALLSLTLLNPPAYSMEDKITYLDNVSRAYTQPKSKVLTDNSYDVNNIETTLKLDSSPIIGTSGYKRVNLSLRDSDIRQTLRMLADKAGVNIAFDESVNGKITLDLNDTTLNEAFSIIFKSSQLSYVLDGNTIIVMSLESAKNVAYTRKSMTVLPVKYVNSSRIAQFLNANLFNSNIYGLSSKPIVTSNPGTNQIVIFGTNADVNAVKRVLPVLDTKPIMNTFKVNHTTPKEMATLICKSLFYSEDGGMEGEGDTGSDGDTLALGGGSVACRDKAEQAGGEEGLSTFKAAPLTVTYFSDLGRISVYGGSPEQANMVRDFIKEHDKKQLMAYIELSVIELNESGSKQFSNTWDLWTPFISIGFDPESGLSTKSSIFLWGNQYPTVASRSVTVSSNNGVTTTTQPETTLIKRGNSHALTYQLKYLVENGNGRVLTNPKIMVTNGRKATIDMTSDYIKSVTSQILQSSSSITSGTQKTYEIGNDEGLLIEITPFISPDGYVSMNIAPEFATIKQQVTSRGESGEPEIAATLLQRRDLDLKNIRVKDGETLVLAGLIKENETQTVKKMPFLSDLPVVGAFFRGNSSSKSREELVIVVTPHIVKDDDNTSGNIYDL